MLASARRHATIDDVVAARERVVSDLDSKYARAISVVRDHLLDGVPLFLGYSGGKDSTVALCLALEGLRQARDAHAPLPALTVLSTDTGIDNPAVAAYRNRMLAQLRRHAARHGLDVRIVVPRPSLSDSWVVSVIGGRGLPTFPESSSRDCSVSLKVVPARRALATAAAAWRAECATRARTAVGGAFFRLHDMADHPHPPVIILGTRFDESARRAVNMTTRGDRARQISVNADGDHTLPLIADFDTDDVWTYLALASSKPDAAYPGFAPDFAETVRIYRDAAGGECVIVADARGVKKGGGCGARHGCALCTAVDQDRSMSAMLTMPGHRYMQPLNALREYLIATRFDWTRQRWTPRRVTPEAVVDGALVLQPSAYGAAEVESLLRYALTIDALERDRAEVAGEPPRFQIVTAEQLILIDFMWARYGLHRPFHALAIYREVCIEGRRFPVPTIETPAPKTPIPNRRVAIDHGQATAMPGLSDPLVAALAFEGGSDAIADRAPRFEVNAEAIGFLLDYDLDRLLDLYHDGGFAPGAAVGWYLRSGIVATSGRGIADTDSMMRHAQWLESEIGVNHVPAAAPLPRDVAA
ncbi:MAG: phosphoadenosine phosphosulfate reductase family protein [Alphaproteobacteria bacterium]|nr:phosphoadenosine phosphosulfate reductase family protein [Alphaproteobacteria bacterium]